ncbi:MULTISPECIES: GNAT family N-acetyltransferase [Corynebacterium]|uniref:GNAT family N-acetyltransferase n=1 Tax=Corynebacterium TaxID=1716 RepID=UPI000B075F92|nr:N-acetyltransferase family protein [Corynebacterium amycolatum]
MIIRQATREDAEAIAEIYNEAVINTVAIWNDDTVSVENRIAWMEVHWDKDYPVFVATLDDEVAGDATFSDFRDFDGFRYTVENSIYVHPSFQGRGIGGTLLQVTIDAAREAGSTFWWQRSTAATRGRLRCTKSMVSSVLGYCLR